MLPDVELEFLIRIYCINRRIYQRIARLKVAQVAASNVEDREAFAALLVLLFYVNIARYSRRHFNCFALRLHAKSLQVGVNPLEQQT